MSSKKTETIRLDSIKYLMRLRFRIRVNNAFDRARSNLERALYFELRAHLWSVVL